MARPGKREKTHARILDAAGRGFRELGFDGAGVDRLSGLADVTSGAFYAHMGSKGAAFQAVVDAGLDTVVATLERLQREQGEGWVEAFARRYLAQAQGAPDCVCVTAALPADVARADAQTRAAFAAGMRRIVERFADGLEGGGASDRQARARAALHLLIGTLSALRASGEEAGRDEIVAATVALVGRIAAGAPGAPGTGQAG